MAMGICDRVGAAKIAFGECCVISARRCSSGRLYGTAHGIRGQSLRLYFAATSCAGGASAVLPNFFSAALTADADTPSPRASADWCG